MRACKYPRFEQVPVYTVATTHTKALSVFIGNVFLRKKKGLFNDFHQLQWTFFMKDSSATHFKSIFPFDLITLRFFQPYEVKANARN